LSIEKSKKFFSIPIHGAGIPCFLYINNGSFSAFVASLTHCIQKSCNKSTLLDFKNLSKEISLYPYLSSIENKFIKNTASVFNAMISPDMSLFPKFMLETDPEPGDLQK
jgi:hypothetical protein